jgi:hypothetical protein
MAAPQHEPTALGHVVELNEGAKESAWHSRELSLQALGATAQSLRAGTNLRGFVEVSALMQSWCSRLGKAVAIRRPRGGCAQALRRGRRCASACTSRSAPLRTRARARARAAGSLLRMP